MRYNLHNALYFLAVLGIGFVAAELPYHWWPGFFFCYSVILWGMPMRPSHAEGKEHG